MIASLSPRFPDIRTRDLKAIHRLTGQLMEAGDLATLGRGLIDGAAAVLPADFMLWNLWTPQMDAILGFEANHGHYREELEQYSTALNATIHHHPVIAAGKMELSYLRPQRMSDYQTSGAFKSNPLFQEVYRHVESNYQIAYVAAKLPDAQIVLSWNSRRRDFTDRDVQLLHLLGMQVAVLSRRIEERRHLRAAWEALNQGLGAASEPMTVTGTTLGASDGRILSGLIRGETRAAIANSLQWRRDTLDRHLGGLRERLGFENSSQLMHALAAQKPSSARPLT